MRWATVLVLLPVQNLRHGSWDYNISWQLLRRSWGSGRSEDVAMLQEDEEWCSGHSRMWNIFCEYKGQFIQRIILKIFSFAAMLLMFQAGSLFLQLCCTANGSSWSLARGIATVVPVAGLRSGRQIWSLVQCYVGHGRVFVCIAFFFWLKALSFWVGCFFFQQKTTPSQMVLFSTFLTMGGRLIATPPKTI